MGNVPAKEERVGQGTGRRRASSLTHAAQGFLPATVRKPLSLSPSKKQSRGEREKLKEQQARGLVVKFDENVDGGYLAPYGTYNLNLDYDVEIVKQAIVDRRLAPFFTPLQEYEEDWTDAQLVQLIDALRLRALPEDAEDEDEDLAYDAEAVEESSLSKKELRRHLSKKFNKELKLKRLRWQEDEEGRYRRERATSKMAFSKDLKLVLYRSCVECPICFLFYPKWMNFSRCCNQAICTECFVQIKRLEPHPPHDESPNPESDHKTSSQLVSEPASCPYCATPHFGVTYTPPLFRTGLGGIAPRSFKNPANQSTDNAILEDEEVTTFELQEEYFPQQKPVRRGSLPANHSSVLTTDAIRPDWEPKLNAARTKLAKKAATATAIHASNMIIHNNDDDFENRMVAEAVRLSLLDQERTRNR